MRYFELAAISVPPIFGDLSGRQRGQLVGAEVEALQRRQLRDLGRQRSQLVAAEVEALQRSQLPDLGRQRGQLLSAQTKAFLSAT